MTKTTNDNTQPEDRIRRAHNPADPFESEFRETLATLITLGKRAAQHLANEDLTVTSVSKDGAETVKPAPMLTTFLRLQREIRAQYRFLTDYLKNPLYTEDVETGAANVAPTISESKQDSEPPINQQTAPKSGGSTSTSTGAARKTLPAKPTTEHPTHVGARHPSPAPPANTVASNNEPTPADDPGNHQSRPSGVIPAKAENGTSQTGNRAKQSTNNTPKNKRPTPPNLPPSISRAETATKPI